MPHKHKDKSHHRKISKSREWLKMQKDAELRDSAESKRPKLEFVLKCDSAGSVEAVTEAALKAAPPEVEISIIHSGIGGISHSDILVAETGSRLIIGFQVDPLAGMEKELNEYAVEARIYNVIYKLIADIGSIALSLIHADTEEEITGTARVIALFKSVRKGIIAGSEVLSGQMALGDRFRIITAMGPVYSGKIDSMHIEKDSVRKAVRGQKVGMKIRDFNKVKTGDIIESYRPARLKSTTVWHPKGGVIKI